MTGVAQKTLLPKLIHMNGNDCARRADVPCQQVVSKRHHPDGSISLHSAQPFGEVDERPREPSFDVVNRKAFDAVSEIDRSLRRNL